MCIAGRFSDTKPDTSVEIYQKDPPIGYPGFFRHGNTWFSRNAPNFQIPINIFFFNTFQNLLDLIKSSKLFLRFSSIYFLNLINFLTLKFQKIAGRLEG